MEHVASIYIISISLVCMLSIVFGTIKTGISPMPSGRLATQNALMLLPEEHCNQIFELGSGWGNVAALFAREHPEIEVTGIELSWLPYLFAKLRYRHPNLQFVRQDFFKFNPPTNSVLFCYLYPEAMEKISSHEAFSQCWILSNTFICPNRQPMFESVPSRICPEQVFLYAPNYPE